MKLFRVRQVRTMYVLAADEDSAGVMASHEPENSAEVRTEVTQATEKTLEQDRWTFVDAYGGPADYPCHKLLADQKFAEKQRKRERVK